MKLFEKEYKEHDPLLSLNWTFGKEGTKYFKDRMLKDDDCVLVAIVENEIVGYLCGGIKKAESYRNLPIVAELENAFVLEKFRSKGIGKQMFDELIKWCKPKKSARLGSRLLLKIQKLSNSIEPTTSKTILWFWN